MIKRITAPLTHETVHALHAGDRVLLSGVVYTARDAAHLRMAKAIEEGLPLPFELEGQVIYYAGPTPAPHNRPVGSIGPTTSERMDAVTPLLLKKGLKGMIGKGPRSERVLHSMNTYSAVYFAALGGAAALMAQCVRSMEVIAFEDFGTESVKRLVLADLPLVVAADCCGNDYYQMGRMEYINMHEKCN